MVLSSYLFIHYGWLYTAFGSLSSTFTISSRVTNYGAAVFALLLIKDLVEIQNADFYQ